MYLRKAGLVLATIMSFLCFNLFAQVETVEVAAVESTQVASAEPAEEGNTNIIEQTEYAIDYDIPDDIMTGLFSKPGMIKKTGHTVKKVTKKSKPKLQHIEGFRIQVFSDGRNPATLQSRAKARGNAVASRFPKYRGQVYCFSSSPNWYTRVGNFETQGEASAALAELKRAFPSFASEMRIVSSPITLIK